MVDIITKSISIDYLAEIITSASSLGDQALYRLVVDGVDSQA